MPDHPGSKNLRPARLGEVRNPEGRNQYSYKGDFERTIDRLLKGTISDEEREALDLPLHIARLTEAGISRGELIAHVTVHRAMNGNDKLLLEMLTRLWPKVDRHEFQGSLGVASPEDDAALVARLAQIARQRSQANSQSRTASGQLVAEEKTR